tara:strand:- start:6519 stop:6668 length:150 start_codon:yes stop_codon:yes gene_type:complete
MTDNPRGKDGLARIMARIKMADQFAVPYLVVQGGRKLKVTHPDGTVTDE